jgi:hypothetical protein
MSFANDPAWTAESLALLRARAALGWSLHALSVAHEVSPASIDLALWALLGRTPQQACDRLNGGVIRVYG